MFSLFPMDSIFAISLGFALRLVVDAAAHRSFRIGASLIGLWEGAVLYHFLEKWPKSVDPYVGLAFRLFVDFLFTESVYRLTIVLLWTGLGFIISDVTPTVWYEKNLRRFYRRARRFIHDFDWNSLKFPLSSATISRVRFYETPPANPLVSTSLPSRRHSVPGNFPGYSSPTISTDTTTPPASAPRRPVPATSLPPSALRAAGRPPKASSNSSVSFEVIPPASENSPIDDDNDDDFYEDQPPQPRAGEYAPMSRTPPPPIIVVPVPEQGGMASSGEPPSSTLPVSTNIDPLPPVSDVSRTVIGEPASSTLDATANIAKLPIVPDLYKTASGDLASTTTLPPANIDTLPEIIEPEPELPDHGDDHLEVDLDPPPPFEQAAAAPTVQPRPWSREKLVVRNPGEWDGDSARTSIISGGNRNSIIVRATLLREQAKEEEKERDRLHAEQKKAYSEKRYGDAIVYRVEQEEANERAMNLHRRASDRFYKAHNSQQEERTIDVHRLKTREAIRKTEIAIRDGLVAGDSHLRVICGRGHHSERGIPVLKLALINAMEQHRIETEVDPVNEGVLIIKLPVS